MSNLRNKEGVLSFQHDCTVHVGARGCTWVHVGAHETPSEACSQLFLSVLMLKAAPVTQHYSDHRVHISRRLDSAGKNQNDRSYFWTQRVPNVVIFTALNRQSEGACTGRSEFLMSWTRGSRAQGENSPSQPLLLLSFSVF